MMKYSGDHVERSGSFIPLDSSDVALFRYKRTGRVKQLRKLISFLCKLNSQAALHWSYTATSAAWVSRSRAKSSKRPSPTTDHCNPSTFRAATTKYATSLPTTSVFTTDMIKWNHRYQTSITTTETGPIKPFMPSLGSIWIWFVPVLFRSHEDVLRKLLSGFSNLLQSCYIWGHYLCSSRLCNSTVASIRQRVFSYCFDGYLVCYERGIDFKIKALVLQGMIFVLCGKIR